MVCSSHMFCHVILFVDLQFYCLADMQQRLHPLFAFVELIDLVETSASSIKIYLI